MKKSKILCAVLAVLMLAGVLCSCKDKNEDRGILLATYDGGDVYSNDKAVIDWTNYNYGYYYDYLEEGTMTNQDVAQITVWSVVYPIIMEADLKEKGITITEEAVREMFDYNKLNYDEYYNDGEGGFEKFKEDSGLDDDFFMLFARRQVIESTASEYLLANAEVSDEDLLWYYNQNFSDYSEPAGYNFSVLVIEVLDLASDEEWAAKKTEAQGYIDRLVKDESYDDIKAEILKKYTSEDGYSQTQNVIGSYAVTESELFRNVDEIKNKEELAETLEEAGSAYPTRDKNADKDSDQYEAYLKYLTLCGQIAQSYAIKNLENGQVYSDPIMFQAGWSVIRFDGYNEKTYYPTLDEVRYDVYKDYLRYLSEEGTLMKDYGNELMEKYHFVIEEFYVS